MKGRIFLLAMTCVLVVQVFSNKIFAFKKSILSSPKNEKAEEKKSLICFFVFVANFELGM